MKKLMFMMWLMFFSGVRSNEARIVPQNNKEEAQKLISATCRDLDSLCSSLHTLKSTIR